MSGTVVGAVIVRDDRVLAARRLRPPDLAGRWEFPGGKVEPGESETAALARELFEELAIRVDVGPLLGRVALGRSGQLALYRCESPPGDVAAGADHDELRWLAVDDLGRGGGLDWLDADRALLPDVVRQLREGARPNRAGSGRSPGR